MANKTPIYYDDPDFDYRLYWTGREYENLSEKLALEKILETLPKRNRLLDIGGGFGRLVSVYAPLFKSCLLIDPSQKLLDQAKDFCVKYKNLKLQKGFFEKLPFKDKQFDTVITVRTFLHLENRDLAIKEAYRVLNNNGYLILEFANKNRLINILRTIIKGDFNFLIETKPVNIGQKGNCPPFISYHPSQIKSLLYTNGFQIDKVISVCNFRTQWLKRLIPIKFLLFFDSLIYILNTRLAIFNYFGPSIFILAQKRE
jgi:ubiquinone/menaquinone biosynthesis C-methylase UbiE